MKKLKTIFSLFLLIIFFLSPTSSQAQFQECTDPINPTIKRQFQEKWRGDCSSNNMRIFYVCSDDGVVDKAGEEPDPACGTTPTTTGPTSPINVKTVFGEITPPNELLPFIAAGGSGAGGISLFLNNLIVLIYVIAAIVFIFLILWSAFGWMTSGGDKEAVANARNRLVYAIMGIILFAVAFAIIKLVGTFTGFNFTARHNPSCPQREEYYPQGGLCKHVFYTGKDCKPVFEDADISSCQRTP